MKSVSHVIERADILKGMANLSDRARIRAVMNGGALGVQSVLNWDGGTPYQGAGSGKGPDTGLGVDLPTANFVHSSMERLAQKIGREPNLKTDMIPIADTDIARKKAEKRARIVRAWDDVSRMELQYPQIGRWLPGYSFIFHGIRERKFGGQAIPTAELRDPFDVYPGAWGPTQQPSEVAVMRHVSRKEISRIYPHVSEKLENRFRGNQNSIPIIGESGTWEGNPHNPVTVVEYMCDDGTYIVCPEVEASLDYIPNVLDSGPAFVMTKKFSFDTLQSQWHHAFGLLAMMTKLNILGLIAAEDSAFRETNIIGELIGDEYERGRFGINTFEPGTRIEKPTGDQLNQMFQAINVMERQFRIVSGYPVADDGQSPNSFATGQGIRELGASASENVKEFQTAIKHGVEMCDMKRLEWEDKMHASQTKKVFWFEGSNHFEENYRADKDINGDYRTERVYGAMATFDENSKIVAGLQLLQAGIIDPITLREQLDGFHNISLIEERTDAAQAKRMLLDGLGQRFGMEKDPASAEALVTIMDQPSETKDILKQLFTTQDPQMTPEQQAMGGAGGMEEIAGGPPPAVQTILSQMEAPGGGVQSVGQLG